MTSKHHEGWTLWPNSRHANWNAVDTGPHRDLLGEVGAAVRAEGLKFGFYYSLMEWDRAYTNDTGTEHWTVEDYTEHTMLPDLKDLVETYRTIASTSTHLISAPLVLPCPGCTAPCRAICITRRCGLLRERERETRDKFRYAVVLWVR